MIISSSPIYTFVDREGRAVSIMVWKTTAGFEVRALDEDNDGVCILAGPSALDGCSMADSMIQALGLKLVREAVIPVDKHGVDLYWEIE